MADQKKKKKKWESIRVKSSNEIQRPHRVLVALSLEEMRKLQEFKRDSEESNANAARRMMFGK